MGLGESKRDKILWEQAAKDFIALVQSGEQHEDGDLLRRKLLIPYALKYLGNLKGKRMLDAGCGDGVFTEMFEKSGASLVGIDASLTMIEAAKERKVKNKLKSDFSVCELEEPNLFPKESFDLILANMVLHEIEEVDQVFENLHSYLKPGGRMIFSILHPAFDMNTSQRLARSRISSESKKQIMMKYELSAPYNYEVRYERQAGFTEGLVAYYFRPVSKYVNLFLTRNYKLIGFTEPTLDYDTAVKNDEVAAYYLPRFLILGGEKQ